MLFLYNSLFKMTALFFLFTILNILNTNFVYGQPVQGQACFHPKAGIYKPLEECPEERDNIKVEDQNTIVCCPVSKSRLPGEISDIKCQEYAQYVDEHVSGNILKNKKCAWDIQDIIVGGRYATSKEFPHMVQIGYETSKGIRWVCSATLISEQYVLTAAHCLSNRAGDGPKYVRMGIIEDDEGDHKQQFNITEIISHPEYREPSFYHDIGLVKLHQRATLNSWVRPACIYTNKTATLPRGIYTSWSMNDFVGGKNSILKYYLDLYDQTECNKIFKQAGPTRLSQGIKNESMLCAGYSKQMKFTCQRDSGGPLQVYRTGSKELSCMYDIIGVASFGVTCGAALDANDVFTRVSYYVKWIEDIVWP